MRFIFAAVVIAGLLSDSLTAQMMPQFWGENSGLQPGIQQNPIPQDGFQAMQATSQAPSASPLAGSATIAGPASFSGGRFAPRSLNDRLRVESEVEESSKQQATTRGMFVPPRDDLKVQQEGVAEPRFTTVWLSSASLFGRAAVAIDSTRLNPAAGPYFLPSAIPVAGEPFFGTGERATVQGSGSAADITVTGLRGSEDAISGTVRFEIQRLSTDEFRAHTPYAFLTWRKFTFGIADTTFSDNGAVPETIDLGGPNARTWIEEGQPLIRYMFFAPDATESGWTTNASIELPRADVLLPENGVYGRFSRYPDFAASANYRQGEKARDPCGNDYFDEFWHLQFAALVRDLGVENAADTVREGATGWGTQLSGRCMLFRRYWCDVELRDIRDR